MNLKFQIELLYMVRRKMLGIMDELSEAQLLNIPRGCKNNILWNIGHCVSSQQGLLYERSGLPMRIAQSFRNEFKKDTSPVSWSETPSVQEVKDSLIPTVKALEEDVEQGLFINYQPYMTSAGISLNSFEEGLYYSNYHEGQHLGSILIMKNVLNGE